MVIGMVVADTIRCLKVRVLFPRHRRIPFDASKSGFSSSGTGLYHFYSFACSSNGSLASAWLIRLFDASTPGSSSSPSIDVYQLHSLAYSSNGSLASAWFLRVFNASTPGSSSAPSINQYQLHSLAYSSNGSLASAWFPRQFVTSTHGSCSTGMGVYHSYSFAYSSNDCLHVQSQMDMEWNQVRTLGLQGIRIWAPCPRRLQPLPWPPPDFFAYSMSRPRVPVPRALDQPQRTL